MINRTEERIKQTGEVFTPLELVDEILEKLPPELFEDHSKTFLDPACGDGNFLVRVVSWKIEHGSSISDALETTYGVDLMPDNIEHCKERLYQMADDYDKDIHGIGKTKKKYGKYVEHNIVCSDAFEWDFENWKPLVTKEEKQEKIVEDLLSF